MTDNFKKALAIVIAIVLLVIIIAYSSRLNSSNETSYVGSANENLVNQNTAPVSQAATVTGVVEEGTPFTSRTLSGGGEAPGWLVSVTETQPKVFTGKLFFNEGVDIYDLFLQETDGLYAGEAKNVKTKAVKAITLEKKDGVCNDAEKNTFEYSLSGTFDGQTLSGCGGKAEAKK